MRRAGRVWRAGVAATLTSLSLMLVLAGGAAAPGGAIAKSKPKPGLPLPDPKVSLPAVGDKGGQDASKPSSQGSEPQPNPIFQSPGVPPPGANDGACHPPREHPFPVVLVHGTYGDQTVSWNLVSPALVQQGYCVFALDYGQRGTQPIERSAAQLRDFVNRVLDETGARKVSIVGHSQGGMMPRWYLRFLGGQGKVADLIGLAPSNHGTTTPAAPYAAQYGSCPACGQQVAGSKFLRRLNAGRETLPGVSYTVVETNHDEVVTPFTSAFLDGPATRVTNVLLQDRCPADAHEHVGIVYDPAALQWIEDALGRPGPADPGLHPACA